ncbi:MAG: SIS domain-containing protein [Comamonadaceae bacterium]|nr:SIS domain-containing protein [Comamonadaceae bacterium]
MPRAAPSTPTRVLALAQRDVLEIEAAARGRRSGGRLGEPLPRRGAADPRLPAAASSSRAWASRATSARKIAATLASTGTPAFFVHPAEAEPRRPRHDHAASDVVIALSNSGETDELLRILPAHQAPRRASSIAITGKPRLDARARKPTCTSTRAVEQEACPLNLAPTASTTAALALGDALAVALLDARGFGADDFARSHPGGALGRKLLMHVRDVMRTGERAAARGASAPRSTRRMLRDEPARAWA